MCVWKNKYVLNYWNDLQRFYKIQVKMSVKKSEKRLKFSQIHETNRHYLKDILQKFWSVGKYVCARKHIGIAHVIVEVHQMIFVHLKFIVLFLSFKNGLIFIYVLFRLLIFTLKYILKRKMNLKPPSKKNNLEL